jgi:hypothetical protein
VVTQISALCEYSTVGLEWVKGHDDDTGNELADYLARKGSISDSPMPRAVGLSRTEIKARISTHFQNRWQNRWRKEESKYKVTRTFFPTPNNKSILKKLSKWSKSRLSTLIQAGTGHGLNAVHVAHWKNISKICSFCREAEQSVLHLWKDCPVFELERMSRGNLDKGLDREKSFVEFFRSPKVKAGLEGNLDPG